MAETATISEQTRASMDTLAERVHILRRRERRSQKNLAELVDCSPTTISNLEQGKLSGLSTEHLLRLADHFGVSIDYLFGRDETS